VVLAVSGFDPTGEGEGEKETVTQGIRDFIAAMEEERCYGSHGHHNSSSSSSSNSSVARPSLKGRGRGRVSTSGSSSPGFASSSSLSSSSSSSAVLLEGDEDLAGTSCTHVVAHSKSSK
jgi:hypothetical protein